MARLGPTIGAEEFVARYRRAQGSMAHFSDLDAEGMKAVLRELVAWQEAHAYPLTFFTEASIDLADDPELMQLMVDANILAVFIGIESPREDSLRETKKFQNTRGDSMEAKLALITSGI